MNKQQYLSTLKTMLPEYESQEILADFEEHFSTGIAEGKTEQEIIESLGSPYEIAKEYGYVEKQKSITSVGTRAWALVGLILFDLLMGIAIIGTLFAVWASLWAVVIALVASGIACLVGIAFGPGPWYMMITAGIAILALAVVMGIGMIYVTKYAFKGLVWYGKLHVKAATGE